MSNEQSQYGVTLLRVSLGILFLAHGLLKLIVFTPAGTVGFFESLGLPGLFAYGVMFGEIFGGLALIAGAYTRLAAAALFPIALGATYFHLGAGWVFSNEGGGWEFPLFLAVTTAVQFLLGSGPLALRLPEIPHLPRALQA